MLFRSHLFEMLSKETFFDDFAASLESPTISEFDAPIAKSLDAPIDTLLNQDSLLALTDRLDSNELPEEARIRLVSGQATISETAHLIFDAAVQENPQLSDVPLPELVSLLPDSLSNAEVYSIVNQYQTLLRDDCAAGSVLSFHELHSLTEQLKESHLSEQTLSSIDRKSVV